MNTAEYLTLKLQELGIAHFFGVPGDYNFNIIYSIQNNPETEWVGCTNELNAGYAADGYAREKGFGAVVTTYGVGELSAMNAIAGSYAENVPVICIVGAPKTKDIEEKSLIHHQFSEPKPYAYFEAYKSVTEGAAFLDKANAKIEIDRLLKLFVRERKPVYICIPEDIAVMNISDRETDLDWMSDYKVLDTVTEKILGKIRRAEHPVILADVLTKRFGAVSSLRKFAEKSGIPVTNFVMGMGLADSASENYIGTYLSEYGNPYAKKLLETTDCLIASGVIYSDFNSFGQKLPYKINSQVAIYGTYVYVDGVKYENIKMSDLLESLAEKVENRQYEFEKSEIGYEKFEPVGELSSEYIYPRLQEFLKEGDIVISEIGLVPYGFYNLKLPAGAVVHLQGLWCSIGWATGAAFGVCMARPDSRVVLVTGDGAHQISCMEVGNILRHGFKPAIIVINNGGYTIERVLSGKHDNEFNNIVKMNYSKFPRIFEGDIWSVRTETADDFDKALRVTGIMNKMCYIEACVSEMDMPAMANRFYNGAGIAETKEKKKSKKEPKQPKESVSEYSTIVHESLLAEEDE